MSDERHSPLSGFGNKHTWDTFFLEEWPQHRQETKAVMKKIDEMHASIMAIHADTKFLPTLVDIAATLRDMRGSLFDSVSGKNVVDIDTVKDLLKAQQASYVGAISTICKVFGVLIVVLAGLKIFLPAWFGG